uniref:HYDIN/VesB/CFA65-like Ig-like domain-containing protein n=1 Tax=Trichogramma kaykai TaxID=54128 RepID=A0ABD2WUX1_9HYME
MYLVEKSSIRSLKLQYRYWLEADIFRSVIDSPARSKIAIKNIIALESMECCKYKRCRDEGMFEKRVDSKIEKSLRNLAQDGTTDSIKNRVYRFPSEYKKVFSQCPEKIMLERKKRKEPTYTCFLPIPEVVVFRNFSIGCNHECLFQLLNRSEVPRLIKLNESQNLFFQVKFAGSNSNTRLAAGLSHIYDVKFHPDEDRDYYHDIEFETDSGSLAVPVIAIGPQPLVTFPDEINVGVTVVKIKKTILISLENIGKIMTRFSIFSDNECFSVCPTKNSLEVGESMKINITFSPMKLGTFSGFIFFRYESGDTTQSFIKGEAIPCDVKLIDHFVQMEDTFLNLSTLSSISIQNNSDYTLTYKWMKHKSIQDDIKENERCYKECHKKFDTVKGVVAEKLKQIIRDRVCSEIQDDIYFNNEHFHITPAHGEVKARSTLTFSVNFQPRKVGDIIAEGFLDISGIENRIPLSLSGTSMGPILELDRESMDVDKIFLCSTYKFEFKCKNVGRIPGTLSYVQKKTEFNTQIGVKPCKVEICEDSIETLSLHFWSDISGSFVERVDFLILESSEVISLILKGIMVTPLVLHKPIDLNFPLVSLGFSSCRKVTIHNSSHVPVEFSISVPCDGWEPAVGHDEFARALTKPDFPREPREFFVKPTRGTVEAKSLLNFRVYYTPNVVRKGTRSIEVRVGKSLSSEPLILPFSYESTITTMNVKPIKINEGRCFLNYPSKHNITIFNPCNVSGYFFVVPQEVSEDLPLIYSLSVNQGYIKAKQYKEIELKIIAKEVGHHFLRINFFSMGHKEPVAFTDVTVTAYGPVVSTEPFNFKFGQINVLKPREFSFNLINESPIPAPYEIAVKNVKKSSILETEYNIGELEPFETIDINISLILRDVGKYTDNLAILVSKGSTFNIKLSAVGVGCSIVFKPNIFPLLDMGYLFRRQDNTNLITLKNESTRIHNMYLANTERENRGKKNDPDDIQEKFRIEPAAFELHPGEERTVECNIRWPNIEVVQEQWYIFANIEGVNKRELLDSSVFSATFIDPIITFNKNELHFFMNFGWNCEDHQLTNEFTITNKTGRDLNAHMIIEKPFNFKGDSNTWTNDKKLTLVDQKSYIVDVFFRSDLYSFEQQVSTKYQGYLKIQYQEHKQTDKILCVTEVNFPCITLVPTIHLYCIYGSNTEQVISLMNDGSLPAHYKMKIHKSSLKFQRINNFNDLLDLQPIEGMVLPNSEMHVTLALDGSERVKFSIDAVCEVMGGVSQTFTIHATTDIVKYYIEDFVLDYGLQLYCEPSVAALKVTNQCLVPLQFSVATSSTLLKIIEYPEVLNPVSEHIIVIERQPSAPGIFNEALHLEVHSDVMEIHVKWFATFPQVYLDVPRNLLAESSVELGYDAVRLFEKENMDVDEMGCESNFSDDQIINCENELSSNDLALLSADEWQLALTVEVAIDKRDIEMAVERIIAAKYLSEQINTFIRKDNFDFCLPPYDIDLGYVAIGQSMQMIIPIQNYGYEEARIKLTINRKKSSFANNCFVVQMDRSIQNSQSLLKIMFAPKKEMFSENETKVDYNFQIEVKKGFVLPIIAKATVIYPQVTVKISHLDFGKIFVGDRGELLFCIENHGLVDCYWWLNLENSIDNKTKSTKNPFSFSCTNDELAPGRKSLVRAFFKPHKMGKLTNNIEISVMHGQDAQIISLYAYIDHFQENSDNWESKKDLLYEIVENIKNGATSIEPTVKISSSENKYVIIFHGVANTEYQETACRCAKRLNLPLLDLNKVFLQSLSSTQIKLSKKLSDQLEKHYIEMTSQLKKSTFKGLSDKYQNQIDKIFTKISVSETFEEKNYDYFELKLEILNDILNFSEKYGKPTDKKGSIKNQELSNNQRVLFKDVNSDVFREILRDGLCQAKFNRGYVLQTLKNDFMKNESLILRILLSISNGTENMLFITFNNKISKLYERTEDDNQTELPFKDEKFSTDDIGIENNVSLLIQQSPEMIKEYEDSLNNLFHTINEWEAGLASGKTRKNAKTATKSIFTLASSILAPEKMYVWHVDIDNLKSNCMTYAIENYLSETIPNFIDDTILDECSVEVIPYFLLKEHEIFELQPFHSVASSFVSQTGMGETFSISKKSLTAETIIRTKSENLNLQLYETISLESRLILEPSESKEFKVVFKPIQEGQFKHEFILALMDNPEKTFKIKTLGDAEIPRLNMTPYSIFSKVASQKLIETHEPTYFLSSHCYDFGNFLVSQDQSRMHNKKEIFKFRNIAIVPAVVSFSLQDKNYDIFEIQPLEIVLNPNEIGFVAISVNVNQLGEWKDTLIISIENNLQNEHIELRCNGVQMELIVEPKSINLNRVLLSKCEMKKVTMQSNTALLLFWRVSTELDENQIRCQPVSGKLKYNHTNEIEINFCANKVHGSETKIIRIFLFLSEKEMEPIAIETITLTAESYEIIFDVSPRDSLCLKSIPVGSFTTGSYTITNLGKYPFSYEINYLSLHGLTTNKKNENKSEILQNNFKMEPQSGIILPKKQSLINVTYNPTIEHSLKDTILFILYLMEPYKDYGLVENVSLKISSISYYTKYSIYPYPTLNFETVELKTNKTMTLKVENTGEFALTYSFKHKPLHESQGDFSIVHEKSKTSKRKCGPKKLRSLQSDGSESRYGPFQIEKMKGELQPREFDNLMVQFRADTVGEFEEYFLIDVSDSYLLTDEDRQISLKANVHVANLDFNNFRQMFVNSYVVNSPEEFDFSNKIEEYTVFIKCDNTLHYHNICANDTYATSVTLSNTSDVRADVIIETSCNEAFSVNINRLEIKPWSKEKFILTFNPSREGIYSDTLQMKLDVPESLDPHTLIINLQGEGCLPRVRVIELNEVARDNSEMHFGFLNIPGKVEKLLKIQNIGKVIAKLNIELENNFPEVFKIIENPDREPIDNECIYKTHDKVTELMILPQYAVNLKISFIITNPGQYISNLKIHIDKNPHETIKMKLIGEGFFKPIVFNLVLVYPKSLVNVSECTSSQSIEQLETGFDKNSYPKTVSEEPINWVYKIDFGNCSMKDQNTYKNRYTFKIINATTDQFFRYEWKDDELIQFDPLISTECIINEIILKEPVKFIGYEKDSLGSIVQYTEKLYTKHRKQKYTEHENSSDTASNIRKLATDDLQESEIEPEYEIVTNTTETIKVLVSANLGYCNYECNIDCLEFESTLVSETRSLNFKVANTSNLNLYFNWCLLSKCSKQKDLKCNCKECNCPFTVRPQRGVIAPQESIECDMLFFPTFVDEFEVSFCCKMINLDPAREPLVIKVLASSILSYPFFDFGE